MADTPDDFRLLPPEGHSREELSQLLEPPPTFQPSPPEIAARPQFTVADVLVVMVGVAVGLAGATWMRPDYFAAVMGLVTLLGLLAVHLWPPESHLGKLIWATIVMAYVMAVLTALLKPAVA
jgi:hypothetical protein